MITLTETAPEELLPWVREQKDIKWEEYLVYRAGRWENPLTGLKEKCVDAVCTACGAGMKLDYALTKTGEANFGFGWYDRENKFHTARSGKRVFCPECGAQVTAKHISYVAHTHAFVWPISLEARGETLILYLWRVERWADRDGMLHWDVRPWEAAVYSQGQARKSVHWTKSMGGKVYLLDRWVERRRFTDTFYDIELVYAPGGICKATLGTCMENSKLEEYMAVEGEYRFPVTWLRLYQRYPNLENLMTCPAAKLTAGLIAREKNEKNYSGVWTTNTDLLKMMDRRKARPWDILRIRKDELAYFTDREKEDGAERLAVTMLLRKKGFSVRPGEEKPEWMNLQARQYLDMGVHPAKAERYIERQKRKYPKDRITEYGLTDYWRDAEYLGMDLNDPELRWPQRFQTAHDAAAERRRIQRDEELKKKAAAEAEAREEHFRKRFERMSRYSWERSGIFIRPARTERELIDEGKALHHCVASYAQRHASGQLTIFFIRRTEDPDTPWFTLNFNESALSVTENRGDHNCMRTPEVQAFEEAWLEWVRTGAKKAMKGKDAA